MKVYKYLEYNLNNENINTWKNEELLILDNVNIADSFFKKLTGLIFNKSPGCGQGLLLDGSNSIHTLWMRFSIDVIFLDKNDRIVYLIENLKPFRFSAVVKNAIKVLELKSGTIRQKNMRIGDILVFKKR